MSTEALITNIIIQNQLIAPKNQQIANLILQIYTDYNKRLSTYKITYVLQRDYVINICVGRIYCLMRTLQLPRMSLKKPFHNYRRKENGECTNHLQQEFNQKYPNFVGVSDFTYYKRRWQMVLPLHCNGFVFSQSHRLKHLRKT